MVKTKAPGTRLEIVRGDGSIIKRKGGRVTITSIPQGGGYFARFFKNGREIWRTSETYMRKAGAMKAINTIAYPSLIAKGKWMVSRMIAPLIDLTKPISKQKTK